MSCTVLGVIPARGGSKGVHRKNLRCINGIPLIGYAIQAAKNSNMITDFIASTDDTEIAAAAKELGADVIVRPEHLSLDTTPMVPVIKHIIENTKNSYEYIAVLQPTTPQRTSEDIDESLSLLIESQAESVISVFDVGANHPSRMYKLDKQYLVPYENDTKEKLRQNVEKVYQVNGAIYACKVSTLLEQNTLIGKKTIPYLMPRERSISVDDELDLALIELLISRNL